MRAHRHGRYCSNTKKKKKQSTQEMIPLDDKLPSSSYFSYQIKRHEFVKLIIRNLHSLGYKKSASLLESESGVPSKSPEFQTLESQILDSNWDDCIDTLCKMEDLGKEIRASALFLVFKQCIIEFLLSGDDSSALRFLWKHQLSQFLGINKVQKLASCIVLSSSFNELGLGEDARRQGLLNELENLLPPPIVVPQTRLAYLVEMAVNAQMESCIYHNIPSEKGISLYRDHFCNRDQIPTETIQILSNHENEVWFVKFSNSGEYLASSSSDCTAIIWKVSEEGILSLKHILRSHQNPVSFVAWSPDDKFLLTCGNGEIKLWDVEIGACKHTFGDRSFIVSSCAWLRDSKRLVCGSSDPNKGIYMWDLDGNELEAWRGIRIPKFSALAITSNGEHVIICSEKVIQICNFRTRTMRLVKEEHTITSLSVSRDNKFLIVNLNSQEIHMWDIAGTCDKPRTYSGHKQENYVIRSCFGGINCNFIASGSENSQVYIWSRHLEKPLEILPGHSMTVNCVSWNPTRPQMLASASNDQTIRIWGPSSSKKND